MKTKSVINIVGTICPPEGEEKFNKWYNEKHVPDLLKIRELKGVTRYKITNPAEGFPTYLAVYEFENQKAFAAYSKSPELTAALEDARNMFKETGAGTKWRVQYECIKSW